MWRARGQGMFGRCLCLAVGAAVLVVSTMSAAPLTAGAVTSVLDPTFGAGGRVITNLGGTYDWAYATNLQPDGKILAAGVSNARGTYDFAVTRYNRDGSLDPSFGTAGVVITDFGGSQDWAYALALQPDGKIVAGGVSDRSGSKDFALARYNPDGSLDRSFGDGGLVLVPVRPFTSDIIRGLALQPDGKIVAAGVTFDDTVSLGPHGAFMIVRYTPDGRMDPTFGVGGWVTTNFDHGSYDDPYAVALQPDGRIVLGGYSNTGAGVGRIFGADNLALARYLPNGLLDPSFGDGGKVVVDAGGMQEQIRALALDPRGRIVVAGMTNGEKRGDFLLGRFQPDGSLDPGFGASRPGLTITDLASAGETLDAVVLTPRGNIVAGGVAAPRGNADMAVMVYDDTGQPNPSFGHGGLATADSGARYTRIRGLALQPDGQVVAVGISETDFALARFATPGSSRR